MRSTNENFDVFNSRDEIYLVFTKKVDFLFILYFFRRFTVNQFVNHASSRITIMLKKITEGVFVTEYLDQST